MQGCGFIGKERKCTGLQVLERTIDRKFGEAWYAELENVAEELEKQHII